MFTAQIALKGILNQIQSRPFDINLYPALSRTLNVQSCSNYTT